MKKECKFCFEMFDDTDSVEVLLKSSTASFTMSLIFCDPLCAQKGIAVYNKIFFTDKELKKHGAEKEKLRVANTQKEDKQ